MNNKAKSALIAVGVAASAIFATTPGQPCMVGQAQVFVAQESTCIFKTHKNLKAALTADLKSKKKDKKGDAYDIEIGNWTVFWETIAKEVKERGLTEMEMEALINGDKQLIYDLLDPNF